MQKNSSKIQKFILKFFPEIMVKGSCAKKQMIGQLYANLVEILGQIDAQIIVKKYSDKIEVFTPLDVLRDVKVKLQETPGIQKILEVLQVDKMDTIDKIKVKVGEIFINMLKEKTFAVRAKRKGKHNFTSMDMERIIGGYLLSISNNAKVKLKNPDISINMELIENELNIITKSYKGLSGFPIGTAGEILSLMSGGFDSTVASYLTMKRGIKTHFIFFNLGGMAHEIGVKQVALYLWSKFGSSHRVKFVTVPFESVIEEIFRSTAPTYMGVMLKRLMLKASEEVADELEIDALLTGESVAQVSSQTLRNLSLIDQVSTKLILRPLCAMNKPEIVSIADDIGTRYFAESMPEYCGVISKNPIIHGSFKRMAKIERKFNFKVLDKAIHDAQYINVNDIVDDVANLKAVEVVDDLSCGKYTVIDIRLEDDCIETTCKSIKIPFHKLKSEFEKLPQDKEYLFYCDKGIMSQLHAQYLRDAKSYKNIRVYRPKA